MLMLFQMTHEHSRPRLVVCYGAIHLTDTSFKMKVKSRIDIFRH